MRTPIDLPPDLIDLLSAFAAAGVKYLLVGGHAVAAHGRPRSTKDVDLWLEPRPANVERTCSALTAFGVPPAIVAALRAAKREDIVWLGRPPARIDLFQSLPGVQFDASWPRRLTIELAGVEVPVIGKADLIRNKTTVGRPQDLRDVRELTREIGVARRPAARKKQSPRKR